MRLSGNCARSGVVLLSKGKSDYRRDAERPLKVNGVGAMVGPVDIGASDFVNILTT